MSIKNSNSSSNRIVIKIGSSSLTAKRTGLAYERMARYVRLTAELMDAGYSPVIVSSGAVAAGSKALNLSTKPKSIDKYKAAAAVGQGLLMEVYSHLFDAYGIKVGQVLLTKRDFTVKESFDNAYDTFNSLLSLKAVPIVNENDVVKLSLHSFGDNDKLAALVSCLLHAEMLIILTDTAGLYDQDPKKSDTAKRISFVEKITPEILALGSNGEGTGGMVAKLRAAQVALSVGISTFIGSSDTDSFIEIIKKRGEGTYFGKPIKESLQKKLQWIAFHSDTAGCITIDEGAKEALLKNGKSLLPAGVKKITGDFSPSDVVEILDISGELLGKGLSNYSSAQLQQALGKSSAFAKKELQIDKVEVVHRDNFVLL